MHETSAVEDAIALLLCVVCLFIAVVLICLLWHIRRDAWPRRHHTGPPRHRDGSWRKHSDAHHAKAVPVHLLCHEHTRKPAEPEPETLVAASAAVSVAACISGEIRTFVLPCVGPRMVEYALRPLSASTFAFLNYKAGGKGSGSVSANATDHLRWRVGRTLRGVTVKRLSIEAQQWELPACGHAGEHGFLGYPQTRGLRQCYTAISTDETLYTWDLPLRDRVPAPRHRIRPHPRTVYCAVHHTTPHHTTPHHTTPHHTTRHLTSPTDAPLSTPPPSSPTPLHRTHAARPQHRRLRTTT